MRPGAPKIATKFLRVLDDTSGRIATYDDVDIGRTELRVARYFEEAHRCRLFGLNVACAVLCRALLEAALVERIDPDCKLKPKAGHKQPTDSHISNMIIAASGRYLDDNRAEAAEMIKKAGNWAIHNYKRFSEHYAHRMGEIVDDTRKILIDLYGEGTRK